VTDLKSVTVFTTICGHETDRFILSKVFELVHNQTRERIIKHYGPTLSIRHYGCRPQLTCMVLTQITSRDGLRDITTCLNAKPDTLYHVGFTERIAKSTLADANENRDWRIWEDLGIDLGNSIYALDSSTIYLSPSKFM
jgi:hypothetical protein